MAIQERKIIASYQRPSTQQAEDALRYAMKYPHIKVVCFWEGSDGNPPETIGIIPYWGIRTVKTQLNVIKDMRQADRVEIICSSPRGRRRPGAGRR